MQFARKRHQHFQLYYYYIKWLPWNSCNYINYIKFQCPGLLLDFYKDDDNDDVPVGGRTLPPARPSPPTTCVHPRSEDTQTTLPAIKSVLGLFK